jgi:hypothetical protein
MIVEVPMQSIVRHWQLGPAFGAGHVTIERLHHSIHELCHVLAPIEWWRSARIAFIYALRRATSAPRGTTTIILQPVLGATAHEP